jgi:nicotinamidase-related amidase
MSKALVIIDIQNDTPKNYKEVIDNINKAIDWAVNNKIHVVYIRHENLSAGSRNFIPDTIGSELASDLKIASKNVFKKNKGNALTSEEFTDFIRKKKIPEMIQYYESKGCKIISLNDLL